MLEHLTRDSEGPRIKSWSGSSLYSISGYVTYGQYGSVPTPEIDRLLLPAREEPGVFFGGKDH